ncbi:MAG: GIY-YIG nuclease family protein [Candidatus Heimdallarchaeaceae archaeon]
MLFLPIISFSQGLKGSYLLFIQLNKRITINLSKKHFSLEEACYIYVGSAFGAGGLKSRVSHHLLKEKTQRWHIDFLTTSPYSEIVGVVYFIDQKVECYLGKLLSSFSSLEPVFGFGNTDCKANCDSHLFKIVKSK